LDLQAAEKREGVAEFRFKANAVLGTGIAEVHRHRGSSEARMEESVSVRPAIAYRTQLTLGRFDGASTTVPLKRDLYPNSGRWKLPFPRSRWFGARA
jgi:alpha-2-macroglobulin